jgi:hypothetical protein
MTLAPDVCAHDVIPRREDRAAGFFVLGRRAVAADCGERCNPAPKLGVLNQGRAPVLPCCKLAVLDREEDARAAAPSRECGLPWRVGNSFNLSRLDHASPFMVGPAKRLGTLLDVEGLSSLRRGAECAGQQQVACDQ